MAGLLRESRLADNRAELSIPFTSSIVFPITVSLTVSEAKDEPATREKGGYADGEGVIVFDKVDKFLHKSFKIKALINFA